MSLIDSIIKELNNDVAIPEKRDVFLAKNRVSVIWIFFVIWILFIAIGTWAGYKGEDGIRFLLALIVWPWIFLSIGFGIYSLNKSKQYFDRIGIDDTGPIKAINKLKIFSVILILSPVLLIFVGYLLEIIFPAKGFSGL